MKIPKCPGDTHRVRGNTLHSTVRSGLWNHNSHLTADRTVREKPGVFLRGTDVLWQFYHNKLRSQTTKDTPRDLRIYDFCGSQEAAADCDEHWRQLHCKIMFHVLLICNYAYPGNSGSYIIIEEVVRNVYGNLKSIINMQSSSWLNIWRLENQHSGALFPNVPFKHIKDKYTTMMMIALSRSNICYFNRMSEFYALGVSVEIELKMDWQGCKTVVNCQILHQIGWWD